MRSMMPFGDGLSLAFEDGASGEAGYPTRRLQKGLTLLDGDEQLAEEGVGFGVPVLMLGVRTVFAGRAAAERRRREDGRWELDAVYSMDLVERLARPGGATLHPATLYAAKNRLAALHRRSPALRGALTATSAALRRALRWETVYEEIPPVAAIPVTWRGDAASGRLEVDVDLSGLPDGVTEVVVMNELGAAHFDRYEESDGRVLHGDDIGTWDEVVAAQATFTCESRGVSFSVRQAEGARLRRGREAIGSRLAWSGFGYSFAPERRSFRYDVTIARRA